MSTTTTTTTTTASQHRDRLRDALIPSIALLQRRRASEIPDGYIDDYVALDWLEWHGGSLRVTVIGENICRQLTTRPEAAASAPEVA